MDQDLFEHALLLSLFVSTVLVGGIFFVGGVVATLQAATQIQDQTLLFVPKFMTVILLLFLCGQLIGEEFSLFFAESLRALAAVRP